MAGLLTDLIITYGTFLEEHTVTFQNEDGTVLYVAKTEHNRAVDDPIVEGYIETPTKAPDTDYVYTFYADWYMKGVLTANRQMNTSSTNLGSWDLTALRKWLNETFYKGLSPQWRNLIAESITLANAGNQTSNITESNDFLRIPSRAEVGFNVNDVPYTNEVASEAAEKAFSLYTDNNSRIKKTFNGEGEARYSLVFRSSVVMGCHSFIKNEPRGFHSENLSAMQKRHGCPCR